MYAVVQLVETLRYKSEGRGFDSRWCHLIFHGHDSGRTVALGLTQVLKRGRCVGLTKLLVPIVLRLKLLEPSGPFQACNWIDLPFVTLQVNCNKYFNFDLFDKIKYIDTDSNPFQEHKLLGNSSDVHVML